MKALFITLLVLSGTFAAQSQSLLNAQKFTENEQFESATREFKSLLQKDPANGDIYYYFGENAFNSEDRDSAAVLFKKGTEVAANNPLNYIGLGKIAQYNGNLAQAQTFFEQAKKLADPKSSLPLMKIAEAYIKAEKKDLDKAFELLTLATKLDPKNPEIYILMGDYYQEKTDGNNAIAQYNKAKELNKASVKAILRQGQLYGRSKNYNLAFEKYQEAAQIDSSFAPAYREQGELYYLSKQYEKAKQKYKRYLDLSGNQIGARIRYASFLFLNKNYDETILQFSEIVQTDSSKNYVNRLLAYSYFEKGDFPNGITFINNFFRRAPKEGTSILSSDYEYRGKLLAKTGKDSLAILDYQQALSMDSTKYDLHGEMGATYFKIKKYQECIAAFKNKEKRKPISANDAFTLGRAYYFSKDFANADSAFLKVTTMQQNLALGYFWRARANAQLDPDSKLGLALPHYETFISKVTDPAKSTKDLVEAYSYLGFYYYSNKDNVKSKDAWTKVKELDPNNEKAKKALESLK
jgi:tetratricopeptide (TPR) repeat protein